MEEEEGEGEGEDGGSRRQLEAALEVAARSAPAYARALAEVVATSAPALFYYETADASRVPAPCFATSGDLAEGVPGLVITATGEWISPPLSDHAARAVQQQAAADVRSGDGRWVLDAGRVRVANPRFETAVGNAVNAAARAWGLGDGSVRGVLSALVLVEGVACPHDAAAAAGPELPEGTFGTLLVALPSHYSGGGVLTVRHGPQAAITFSEGADAPGANFKCAFVAFFANCALSTEPLAADGRRLYLVYHLYGPVRAPGVHPGSHRRGCPVFVCFGCSCHARTLAG